MSNIQKLFRREHSFELPGVGMIVIRNISERERETLYAGVLGGDGDPDWNLWTHRLVSMSLVSIDGDPSTITAEQVPDMDLMHATRIAQEIRKHCGFSENTEGN